MADRAMISAVLFEAGLGMSHGEQRRMLRGGRTRQTRSRPTDEGPEATKAPGPPDPPRRE